MISKRTVLILGAIVHLSIIQTIEASLWQSICSPFSNAATYCKQRPLVAIAALVSAVGISGGIYWWYKKSKKRIVQQSGIVTQNAQQIENLDPALIQKNQLLDQAINKWKKAIADFQNAKNLISRHEKIESSLFYAQLSSFLPLVREALNVDQKEKFDALKFAQIAEGEYEYWNACARLFFDLDVYIASAQESLKTVQEARNPRA